MHRQVKGFKGAQYKGFKSEGEALTYLGQRHAASQGLGISQISQQISKRVSHAAGTKGKSAAQLLGQHAYSNIADVKEDADYDSRQASSRAAGPSGRPCAESQQTYSLVRWLDSWQRFRVLSISIFWRPSAFAAHASCRYHAHCGAI